MQILRLRTLESPGARFEWGSISTISDLTKLDIEMLPIWSDAIVADSLRFLGAMALLMAWEWVELAVI